MATQVNPFANDKNQALKALILDNPGLNYDVVEAWLAQRRTWFKRYCEIRKEAKLPYKKRNELIFELIDLAEQDNDIEDAAYEE